MILSGTSPVAFLRSVESRLEAARVLSPRAEAEMLIEHFGRIDRLDFFTGGKSISASARRLIEKAIRVRKTGQPLSYLTGEAPFYGRSFRVTKDTLIPRPETEVLVEETLRLIKRSDEKTTKILDIGTGSGCIAISLTLEYPACKMTALDTCPKALQVARKNAVRLGVGRQVRFVKSRFFSAFSGEKDGFWDFIVSNPPYVPKEDWKTLSREVRSEPRSALDGGPRGLVVIEEIIKKAPRYLKDGGTILIEIGKGQSAPLKKILKMNDAFQNFRFVKDLNGIDRILVARKHG